MNKKEELLKLKRERTKIRVIGFCIMPLGYAIMGLCLALGSPLGIIGVFTAFIGIVLVIKSFFHVKYAGLNKAIAEYRANPELQYIPEDVNLGIMNVVRSTFEKHFEDYGIELLKQQYTYDTSRNLVYNRMNQALAQIANLNRVDDNTLFMLYAFLCERVRAQDSRAVVQNECVFRTLYKKYCNSLEVVKEKTVATGSQQVEQNADDHSKKSFVSFSEADSSGRFNEAYRHFRKSNETQNNCLRVAYNFYDDSIRGVTEISSLDLDVALQPLYFVLEKFMDLDYSFCTASTSGGTDEVSHTGYSSYGVQYTDYMEFKKRIVSDFEEESERQCRESGQWITILNFRNVDAFLKKENALVCIMIFANRLRILWEKGFNNEDMNQIVAHIGKEYGTKYTRSDSDTSHVDANDRFSQMWLKNWNC